MSARRRIYGLCSADDGVIRYVGLTTVSLKRRRATHLEAAVAKGDSPVQQWIREIGARKLRIVQLIERGSINAERAEIARRVALGEPLLNVNDGGPCAPTQRKALKCLADGERHHRTDEVAADAAATRAAQADERRVYIEPHPGRQIADAFKPIRPREPRHINAWRDAVAARLAQVAGQRTDAQHELRKAS